MASFKLSLFFSFLFFALQPSKGDERCPAGCGAVPIRFPFQMISSPPEIRCGYQGFNVKCENETQNIVTFPLSGEFRIASINYSSQLISISDPKNCTPERLLQGFNHSGTPFQPLYTRNFTFLNCKPDAPVFRSTGVSPIPCLSSHSNSVVALPTDRYNVSSISSCMEIATFLCPSSGADDSSDSLGDSITLTWKEPDCQRCESLGGDCQFKDDTSSDVGCFKPFDPGFAAYFSHAVFFVMGSGLWILALIIYVRHKIKNRGRSQPNAEISNSTRSPQKGLDTPTIEMYPTTLLGESMQLPKSTDNICPICLLEYQAKEVLRTIPSCMHYFHADCIDEWLKRNATCPLCRN